MYGFMVLVAISRGCWASKNSGRKITAPPGQRSTPEKAARSEQGEHDAVERERLDETYPQEHERPGLVEGLGLAALLIWVL